MGRVEGAAAKARKPSPKPVAAPDGSFAGIVEAFKAEHPDAWAECKLWPTESGLAFIADKLK